jgi:hypothetical protein
MEQTAVSNIIKLEKPPLGVTFWAQVYQNRIPRYEVFKFIGRQRSTGVYYFQSVREKTIIGKSFYQLNQHGFIPFCIDFEKMLDSLE